MASTLKHLRSSTADKRPTASGLADGQLAINTASGTPGLFFKDSASQVVKVGPVHVGPTPPNDAPAGSSGNSRGELWVDNSLTTPGLNYYTGTAFVNLTPSGTTSTVGLVELATNAETQTGSDSVRAVTPAGLQSKVSDSVSTTSSISIASSTAVKTAYDLAAAALPASGGRVTGTLEIGPSGFIAFEGSSDDSFETFLTAVNPTADRTITFPNITGTLITDADTGTVTNTMLAGSIATTKLANGALPSGVTVNSSNIVDGSIVNADISASAAIAYSKLSLGTSIVDGDISTTAAIAGTKISPNFGSQNIVTTGNVNIDSGTFYVDAVNNRVGVGTTGPSYLADFVGTGSQTIAVRTATSGDPRLYLEAAGANAGFVNYSRSAQALQLSGQNPTVHATLDASGNLGLGVVPVSSQGRSIQFGTAGALESEAINTNDHRTNLTSNAISITPYANAYKYLVTGASATMYRQLSGVHQWFTAPTGTAGATISFTQAMTLTADGNLGIGGTPVFYYPGSNNIELGNVLRFRGNAEIAYANSALNINNFASTPTIFYTSNTERMRITSAGNVGIGTTSPDVNLVVSNGGTASSASGGTLARLVGSGVSRLDIVGGNSSYSILEFSRANLTAAAQVAYEHSTNSLYFTTNGTTERARIDSSGNFGLGNAAQPFLSLRSTTNASSGTILSAIDSYSTPYSLTNARIAFRGGYVGYSDLGAMSFQTKGFDGLLDRMFIASDGKVGIGTTSPGSILHCVGSKDAANFTIGAPLSTVGGAAFVNYSQVTFENTSGSNSNAAIRAYGNVWNTAGSELGFLTSNNSAPAERLRISAAGNVGIGTTSPGYPLAVKGSIGLGVASNGTVELSFDNSISGEALGPAAAIQGTYTAYGTTSAGALIFKTNSAAASATEKARIDSSGRLLVGTTSATNNIRLDEKLTVVGNSNTGSTGASFVNYSGTVDHGAIIDLCKSRGASDGAMTIVQAGDNLGYLVFRGSDGTSFNDAALVKAVVEGTPAVGKIASRLVFSTTADGAATPTERMRIANNGTTHFLSTADAVISRTSVAPGTTNALYFGLNSSTSVSNGNICFVTWSNGNVQNTNNSYGAYSDIKLKENIVDATSQWSDIKSLQVRKYNFKEGQTHTQIGLIAQEVELISPGLVTESPDRDADGNDLGTVTKSVNYSVLYMKAVKALQEAMERIETLETKVAALENR